MIKALESLAADQERQADAWEQLAKRGWPTPQNNTFAGGFPRSVTIDISSWPQMTTCELCR